MTENDSQKAARDAAAAFIQSAAPTAGAPNGSPEKTPAQAALEAKAAASGAAPVRQRGHGARVAVIVALVIAFLVLAGIGTFLFTQGVFNKPVASQQETQRVPLSDARVIAAFDEVAMEAPDISQYAYVSQDALIGPKFSDIVVNEPVDLGGAANQIVECTATATATFKNKGIEIAIPVTLPFDYSPEGETWVPGELTQGEATATPLASASASEIVANLNAILTENDPTYGEAMADATIVKTTADLTIDGGPIAVELSKTGESEADGKKYSELRTCAVELAVTWSNDKGWLVTVAKAGEIDYKKNEIIDPNAAVAPADTSPQSLGAVNFGDTVTLAGTLEAVENAGELSQANSYTNGAANLNAGGSVQLVLRLARPVDMTLNGTAYRLTAMAVALGPNVTEDEKNSLIGRKADVKGPLDENFVTNWCPAGIKAMEIHVE